jgi:hypothetical protein
MLAWNYVSKHFATPILISDWFTSGKMPIFSTEAEAGWAAELIITQYGRKKFTARPGKEIRFSNP